MPKDTLALRESLHAYPTNVGLILYAGEMVAAFCPFDDWT